MIGEFVVRVAASAGVATLCGGGLCGGLQCRKAALGLRRTLVGAVLAEATAAVDLDAFLFLSAFLNAFTGQS
jgi:hypothetical protein